MRGWKARVLVFGLALAPVACDSSPTGSVRAPSLSLDVEGSSLGPLSSFVGDSVSIRLRPDTNAPTRFWFSFLVRDGEGRALTFRLEDALQAASAETWAVKRPVASADAGDTWSRIVDTDVQGPDFIFRHTPASDEEWIALGLPYNVSRWAGVLADLASSEWVLSAEVIGSSIDGNPVELIRITDPGASSGVKSAIWAVGRQHPGEPEGSFVLEGFLDWLVGSDPEAAELRRRAEIFVAGFLNPDGVLAGNQRVNRPGLDLNRTWANPAPETAPTVLAVQREIRSYVDAGGTVRILIDFHAAPGARSNFFFYNEEATSTPELHAEVVRVMEAATRLNPDFVPLSGSTPRTTEGGERARNWAFVELGTHGLTVEASANDVTYGPFSGQYVTEERLLALGEAVGRAVAEVLYGVSGSSH